jgi:S1-C subfamily serine protease
MMGRKFREWILPVLVVLSSALTASAQDQMPEDVQDMFEVLIDDLDEDLARKFKRALKTKSTTIHFTPEQFRRFRDNPANPFDGLEDVEAHDGSGNIALKFELPSLRRRSISIRERQHSSQLAELNSVTRSAAASTVGIFDGERQVALGIIVDRNGLIITKASEIDGREDLTCRFFDGREVAASFVRSDERNDVAALTVDPAQAGSLNPIQWSQTQPLLGSFVAAPGYEGEAISFGTFSSNVRSTVFGEQAFLGVQPQTTGQGVLITDVRPGNASYEAGLRDGDVILKMGGQRIADVADLVYFIRTKRPGDKVAIEYLRSGATFSATAELAGRRLSGERAARFKIMSRLGAIPSRRADGFPAIFQHDAPLFPEQCGGPLVDLEGNLIGMNIARSGRDSSYAIPASHLQTVVEGLSRSSLALRDDDRSQN